ncbi:MAG: MBL fold metallo-hydrolase [Aigarchaeota archaeon]|nr:MBL fold metallo-hydrolase [Aigarchaeota archaeon]MDW8092175.1 MBL fold metallo-hydrolase [Nitrososphaerota archaeon]
MLSISYDRGPRLRRDETVISFDSSRSGDFHCVSHAHADHRPSDPAYRSLMTLWTSRLLAARGTPISGSTHFYNYDIDVKVYDEIVIRLVNAGHMLGSSMFEVRLDGHTLLYTGDINTEGSILDEPARPVRADYLVLEATYGDPSYRFKPRETIYSMILRWIVSTLREGFVPAFKVYSAGKSQEIMGLVNSSLGVPVISDSNIARVSAVYRDQYPQISYFHIHSEEGREVLRDGEYVLISSARIAERISGHKLHWAVATGWAQTRTFPSYKKAFPLSAHDDFYRLMRFVEEVDPRFVFTVYGFSRRLAANLRRTGRRALAIDESQMNHFID